MSEFSGKVALIGGVASGIGAACTQAFAAQGATVVGVDLREHSETQLS